jgi:hypothetical protein
MELSELDLLQQFMSKLQAWQMQLNGTYHTSMHLRDRIVQLFSANEAVQIITSRCSVIPGRINDKVIRRKPRVLCVENVYHNKKKQRQTRRLDKSRAKCWVCGKLGHFARDMNTDEEVKSARSAGRTVSAIISDLRQEEAAVVWDPKPLTSTLKLN